MSNIKIPSVGYITIVMLNDGETEAIDCIDLKKPTKKDLKVSAKYRKRGVVKQWAIKVAITVIDEEVKSD